jgi:preprotein translocase subunit SecY
LTNNNGELVLFQNVTFNTTLKYWKLKINGSNFKELGNYNYRINCYDGNLGGALVGSYEITKSGKTLTIEKSIIIMALFFGLIAFGIFNFLLGSKISENYFIGVIFIVLGVVVSLILLNFVVTASKELISEEFFNVGDKLLTASLIITSFLILIFGIFFLFNAINELRIKKEKKKYGENYNPQTKQYEY